MSNISYAQNFEDVMLWRALGHIPMDNSLWLKVRKISSVHSKTKRCIQYEC